MVLSIVHSFLIYTEAYLCLAKKKHSHLNRTSFITTQMKSMAKNNIRWCKSHCVTVRYKEAEVLMQQSGTIILSGFFREALVLIHVNNTLTPTTHLNNFADQAQTVQKQNSLTAASHSQSTKSAQKQLEEYMFFLNHLILTSSFLSCPVSCLYFTYWLSSAPVQLCGRPASGSMIWIFFLRNRCRGKEINNREWKEGQSDDTEIEW